MGNEVNRDGTIPRGAAASRTLYAPVKESQAWLKQDDFTSPCTDAMEPLRTRQHDKGSWNRHGDVTRTKGTLPRVDEAIDAAGAGVSEQEKHTRQQTTISISIVSLK